MIRPGPALRLTVFLGEDDQVRHRPRYAEVVHAAHAAGLAGASVLRGIEGYGAGAHIHTGRLLSLAEGLPVLVIIVDAEAKIREFLPRLASLVGSAGLVTVEAVEVVGPAPQPGNGGPTG
jgi:PII-like signaling protein